MRTFVLAPSVSELNLNRQQLVVKRQLAIKGNFMKKYAFALISSVICATTGAMADSPGDKIAGYAAMHTALPQTVVLPHENWALDGAFAHSHFNEFGFEGNGSALGLGAGVKINNGFQVNAGIATRTKDFGDDYAVRLGARIGGKWMSPAK